MAKLISLSELRALGANTFADIRRDEQLKRDRLAVTERVSRHYSFNGGPGTTARVQLAQALEYCVEAKR